MKESISIKNFGPVKEIHIADIKPLTVLIGESGSGKSTLMKVLAIFRHIEKIRQIRSYLKHSGLSKSPFRIRMESYWANSGFASYLTPGTEVVYTTSYESGKNYILRFSDGKLHGTAQKDLIDKKDLCLTKIAYVSELRSVIPYWVKEGASIKASLGFYFNEVFGDFRNASEQITFMNMDYLKVRFKVMHTSRGSKYSIVPTSNISTKTVSGDYEIGFESSSSGMQNAAPLLLIVKYLARHYGFEKGFNDSVLKYLLSSDRLTDFKFVSNVKDLDKRVFMHIEEPELSLFPDAQCALITDIIASAFDNPINETHIILSTHSPYIVNHLNLLIRAYEKDSKAPGAQYPHEKLSVYRGHEGKLEDLMVQNEKLVNTNPLSQTINDIYDQYNQL